MDSVILGLRVLVALGAVLGLMWYLQRRLGKAKGHGRRRANRTLSVVSRQSVGQKASVVVIDAGDKRFLLGVTEHSINVLHAGEIPVEAVDITTPEQRAALPAPGRVAAAPSESFAAVFQEAAGMPRRAELHRRVGPAALPGSRVSGPGVPASKLHGSLLAGSTWRQAAEALRGRRS
ncbi:flagellar protein FliO/FliZ [Arthrobacter sp. AG258]|uniref:flagellar biosynthetic protein FliO n=1 Tax=Arthrobacter sp. AG258 TaxID=2183899 RepID=UPI00105D3959|nr:flagellar biosynthetic protein FliO [Arthrobacter sp. AG258]TDT85978.1 flagellar protein FliO/FliZ [Arthrobacter sp. AG258]